MKIDDKRVVVGESIERQELEQDRIIRLDQEDFFYFYYPNKKTLVINALIAGIEDAQIFVNRGVLDFLLSHMPITSDLNTIEENV